MPNNILIINVHSSCNAGDHALTQATITMLEKQFPKATLKLAIDDPDSYKGTTQTIGSLFTWVKNLNQDRIPEWSIVNLILLIPCSIIPIITYRLFGKAIYIFTPKQLQALLSAYFKSDLVISKPGGFLYSSGRGLTLIIALISMSLAVLADKPLYILPQSIGPLNHSWERYLVKLTLNQARIIMVREKISLHKLISSGANQSKCHLIPDLAFSFFSDSRSSAINWLRENNIDPDTDRPLLGITTINWEKQNPKFSNQSMYENGIAEAARYFIDKLNGKVILFCQVWGPSASQDDRIPARRIAALLESRKDSITQINEPIQPKLLKSIYGYMDLLIGTRMHSNIFALCKGVPIIAIEYQHKTSGIIEMLGLEDWLININSVNNKNLPHLIEQLWSERNTIKNQINTTLPNLIQQANMAGNLISKDFISLQSSHNYEKPNKSC